ncbi:MAG: GntR family transcriptional regulator [Spirochaetales bacterium]|nr:GntR family transcriptional regulator [Spirochaetales bacterium]
MLNLESPVPLYYQLQELLRNKIEERAYKPGDKIPSEKELVETFDVSRITVRNAISALVFEGLLVKKQGRGTIVAHPRLQEDGNSRLLSFTEKMAQQGIEISTEVLKVLKIPATQRVADFLDIQGGQQVIYVKRLRLADGEPIALFENYISLDTGVTEEDDFSQSVYQLYEKKCGIKISGAEKFIEASAAGGEHCEKLGLVEGEPTLVIRIKTLDIHNKPIEFSEGFYRGDRFQYSLSLTR